MKTVLTEMRDALKAKDRMGVLAVVAARVADLLTRVVAIGQEAKSAASEVSRIVKSAGVKAHRTHRTYNMSKSGRSRIAEAQKRRWIAYRKAKLPKKAVSKIVASKKRERSAAKAEAQ
jgi:hypothetical protein